jgi:hypothetical protein
MKFAKGNKPWNKGVKGIHLNPETEFKEGVAVGENHPSWKGGVQIPKSDCKHVWEGVGKRARLPRKIWEQHNGEIPKGSVIIHIDGDRYNDSIDNLECITRAELLKRNRYENEN